MRVNFNFQVDPAGNLRPEQSFPIVELIEYRLGGIDMAIAGSEGIRELSSASPEFQLPRIDDVKLPGLDKQPGVDGVFDPRIPQILPQRSEFFQAPFILATPHHMTAWAGDQPPLGAGGGENPLSQSEAVLASLEQLLAQLACEMRALDRQYQQTLSDYESKLAEYQQLAGGS